MIDKVKFKLSSVDILRSILDQPLWSSMSPPDKLVFITLILMMPLPYQALNTTIHKIRLAAGAGITRADVKLALSMFDQLDFFTVTYSEIEISGGDATDNVQIILM